MDPQYPVSPWSLIGFRCSPSGWRRNGPAGLANFPLGLRQWLEGKKARGPQQENMEELAGLELKVLGDILESPH